MFAPHTVDSTSTIDLQARIDTLSSLNSSTAIKVCRSWVRAWASSQRYHEATGYPCLLGCKLDELSQYVQGLNFLALIDFFLPLLIPRPEVV